MPRSDTSDLSPPQLIARAGPPTVYEIATRAGVSIATVSRVVNGSARIRPATRARVQEAIDALGFVPNGSAQGMARRATGVLCLIYRRRVAYGDEVPADGGTNAELLEQTRQTMIYHDALIRNVEEAAFDRGYALLLAGAAEGEADARLLKISGQCDGMIIADAGIDEAAIAKLTRQVPVVSVADTGAGGGIANVAVDNVAAMIQLVDHMVNKHRAKRIAFIGGPRGNADAEARARAVLEQAARRNCELDSLEEWRGDYSPQTAFDIVKRRCGMGNALPDVIMCANDGTAAGAIAALHDLGYHVPRDVAVTGFDDLEIAHITSPPLTTIRQPLHELARLAVEELVRGIGANSQPIASHQIRAEMVVRGSCGCRRQSRRAPRKVPAAMHVASEATLSGPLAEPKDGDIIGMSAARDQLEARADRVERASRKPGLLPGLGSIAEVEPFAPARIGSDDPEADASAMLPAAP